MGTSCGKGCWDKWRIFVGLTPIVPAGHHSAICDARSGLFDKLGVITGNSQRIGPDAIAQFGE